MLMVSDMSDPHCDPGQDVDYRSEEALFKDIDQDDARRLRRVHGFEPNSDDEEDCEAYRRGEEEQQAEAALVAAASDVSADAALVAASSHVAASVSPAAGAAGDSGSAAVGSAGARSRKACKHVCPGCPPPCMFSQTRPGQAAVPSGRRGLCMWCNPDKLQALLNTLGGRKTISRALNLFETHSAAAYQSAMDKLPDEFAGKRRFCMGNISMCVFSRVRPGTPARTDGVRCMWCDEDQLQRGLAFASGRGKIRQSLHDFQQHSDSVYKAAKALLPDDFEELPEKWRPGSPAGSCVSSGNVPRQFARAKGLPMGSSAAAEPRESIRACPRAMQRKRSADEVAGASSFAAPSVPSVLSGSSAWWWRDDVSSDEIDASSGPDLSAHWLKQNAPSGPATYAEVADIVPKMYRQLASGKANTLGQIFKAKVQQGILMTSNYSGMGCPELAASLLTSADDDLKHARGFTEYSVCDINPDCTHMMLNKKQPPKHVFVDIKNMLPPSLRDSLMSFVDVNLATADAMDHGIDPGLQGSARQQNKERIGNCMLKEIMEKIEASAYNKTSYCCRHSRECPLFPEPNLYLDRWRFEVARLISTPWSVTHCGPGSVKGAWLHESTLLAAIWLGWVLKSMPQMAIVECASGFDHKTFCAYLTKNDLYGLMLLHFSPVHMGIPSSRPRKYMLFFLRSALARVVDNTLDVFSYIFFRKMVVDYSIYMIANASQLKCLTQDMKHSRSRECREDDQRSRIAELPGSNNAPAFVTASLFWDLASDCSVVPWPEHFAAMGFPLDQTGGPLDTFPWTEETITSMQVTTQRLVTSNGMHLAQIGACIAFLLGSTADILGAME